MLVTPYRIEISKIAIIRVIGLSFLFFAASLFAFYKRDSYVDPVFMILCAAFGMVISISAIFTSFYLLITRKFFAFSFTEDGIIKHYKFSKDLLIKWGDIKEFKPIHLKTTINGRKSNEGKYLFICVKNPDFYISHSQGLGRLTMISNMKKYGAPFFLSVTLTKFSFDELIRIADEWFESCKLSNSINKQSESLKN